MYGPQNAVDGLLMTTIGSTGVADNGQPFFQSADDDLLPWLQIDYGFPKSVTMVMITAVYSYLVKDIIDESITIKVHVGDAPGLPGQLSNNDVCANYNGPIVPNSFEVFECSPILSGQYVLIQQDRPRLLINDLIVFTTDTDPAFENGFREARVPESLIEALASSVYNGETLTRGPQFLIDGVFSARHNNHFASGLHPDPWIHLTLMESTFITRFI